MDFFSGFVRDPYKSIFILLKVGKTVPLSPHVTFRKNMEKETHTHIYI